MKFLLGLYRTAFSRVGPEGSLEVAEVNQEPAFVFRLAGELDSVYVISIDEGVITGVRIIRNPDKLAYIDQQLASLQSGT
jgi:RNA polymerase sigma-70 factor (ECF subfamily)